MTMPFRERLDESPLLVALSDEQMARLIETGEVVAFKDGDTIIREGEFGDAIYLILHGKVRIVIGAEKVIANLSSDISLQSQYEGDFFGELSILDHETRSADVVAVGEVTLFKIGREELYTIFRDDVEFQVVFLTNLSRILSRRLRRSNMRRISS